MNTANPEIEKWFAWHPVGTECETGVWLATIYRVRKGKRWAYFLTEEDARKCL